MELNEEAVEKSLDWLDSLVGNSNDSDIALLTYQLLGILYDTCKELTEENEGLITDNTILKQKRTNIFEIGDAYDRGKIKGVRQMQERLTSCFCPDCDYSGHDVRRVIDQIAKEMSEGEK